MPQTRRQFIATSSAAVGMTFVLPFAARAASHSQDEFTTSVGTITVHPGEPCLFCNGNTSGCNLLRSCRQGRSLCKISTPGPPPDHPSPW